MRACVWWIRACVRACVRACMCVWIWLMKDISLLCGCIRCACMQAFWLKNTCLLAPGVTCSLCQMYDRSVLLIQRLPLAEVCRINWPTELRRWEINSLILRVKISIIFGLVVLCTSDRYKCCTNLSFDMLYHLRFLSFSVKFCTVVVGHILSVQCTIILLSTFF